MQRRTHPVALQAKFGHAGLMTYADFQDFHYIVTDQPLDAPYAEAVKRAGATVLTP